MLALGFAIAISGQAALAQSGPQLQLVDLHTEGLGGWWNYDLDHIGERAPDNGYSVLAQWQTPPQAVDGSGFSLTITVTATSQMNFAPHLDIAVTGEGFIIDPSPATISVATQPNATNSGTLTVQVTPAPGIANGSQARLTIGTADGAHFETFIYQVNSGGGNGQVGGNGEGETTGDDDDDQDSGTQTGQLAAELECPGAIVVSAFPPLDCTILISNFTRNTSKPVQVILPAKVDEFGNHIDGVQLINAEGAVDVYEWPDVYRWSFFVFACPSQSHEGMNCFTHAGIPGDIASIPIVVRQEGAGEVQLTLSMTLLPPESDNVSTAMIGNFATGDTISMAAGALTIGPMPLDMAARPWRLVPVPNTNLVQIESTEIEGMVINIVPGVAVATPVAPGSPAAMWLLEQLPDADLFRIRNALDPSILLFQSGGTVAAGQADPNAESSQWWLLR